MRYRMSENSTAIAFYVHAPPWHTLINTYPMGARAKESETEQPLPRSRSESTFHINMLCFFIMQAHSPFMTWKEHTVMCGFLYVHRLGTRMAS